MSTDGIVNTQPKVKDNVLANSEGRRSESESTADSSGSSSSQSESGDESSGSSSASQQVEYAESAAQPAVNEQYESDSGKSNESFKSMNASMAKSIGGIVGSSEGKGLVTPAKSLVKSSVEPAKFKSPPRAGTKSTDVPVVAAVAPIVSNEGASPVQVTPAKTLVFSSPSLTGEVDFEQLSLINKAASSIALGQPVSPSSAVVKARRSPGEYSESETAVTKPTSESRGIESDASRKRNRSSLKTPSKEVRSPRTKRNKRDKERAVKSSTGQQNSSERVQAKTVEEVQEQVRLLQAQLEEVRNISTGHRKHARKNKKHKAGRSGKSRTQSSAGDSSRSSSPDRPTTSSRIAKISMGRKLQGLAMTRAKQLGSIRLVEVHDAEVSEALKLVMDTVFSTDPTQAYSDFHKIPGTGLAHITKHLDELKDDIGLFVVASAKLNLELDHEQSVARKQRVNNDVGNECNVIWQFSNDLARAPGAPDQQGATPGSSQSTGVSTGGSNSKPGVVDKKPQDDQGTKAAGGQDMNPAAVITKSAKKKKSAGSKSEERG